MANVIGVVSDTHNNLVNVREIVALFNAAGVSKVVHTGDITRPKRLTCWLASRCPCMAFSATTMSSATT